MVEKVNLDLEKIELKISEDGKMQRVTYKSAGWYHDLKVIGSTVPLSVRSGGGEVREFYILPFEQDIGLIILWCSIYGGSGRMEIVYVSNKDGCPYLHKLDRDDKKWIPSIRFPTQFIEGNIEVAVDGNKFGTSDNSECIKTDGDLIARYLNEEISANDLRLRVLGKDILEFSRENCIDFHFKPDIRSFQFWSIEDIPHRPSMVIMDIIWKKYENWSMVFRKPSQAREVQKVIEKKRSLRFTVHPETSLRFYNDEHSLVSLRYGRGKVAKVYINHNAIKALVEQASEKK